MIDKRERKQTKKTNTMRIVIRLRLPCTQNDGAADGATPLRDEKRSRDHKNVMVMGKNVLLSAIGLRCIIIGYGSVSDYSVVHL